MIKTETFDLHSYLPPYRSLLSPNAQYDYKTHSLIPIGDNDKGPFTALNAPPRTTSKIKMKYKSLLGDVSKRTSILSLRIGSVKAVPVTWKSLPFEILNYIFQLVDDFTSYRNCLVVCKQFYQLVKPILYEELYFTSTYRFAQFITYLRLNSDVGQYVKRIDLSQIKPGVQDDDISFNDQNISVDGDTKGDNDSSTAKILASWRDWKYKNNPLYTNHPSLHLTKVISNSLALSRSYKSINSHKMVRLSKTLNYFKSKKRPKLNGDRYKKRLHFPPEAHDDNSSHPLINKFLLNYSNSKDIPIGYVLHMLALCPNIVSLNLGNLSLSTDYEINKSMIYKYKTFDLINNYPKDLVSTIDHIITNDNESTSESLFSLGKDIESSKSFSIVPSTDSFRQQSQPPQIQQQMLLPLQLPTSSASSMYSVAFAKPKYNSLLPPLPTTVTDISYMNKGDGKIYLSDLNLKSINEKYLIKINENEILKTICKFHNKTLSSTKNHKLNYINLSSMIWLTKSITQWFLDQIVDSSSWGALGTSDEDSVDEEVTCKICKQDLIIELSDSGMYKHLEWAQLIDLNQIEGCKLANKIIKDEILNIFDDFIRRERVRRGRIGENYLH